MISNFDTICIIQARLTSSRLPNKVLMKLCGKTVAEHVYERLIRCESVDKVIFAIPDTSTNDILFNFLIEKHIDVFRGSENNVMDRFIQCAKLYNPNYIVRATCDNPLVDIDKVNYLVEKIHNDKLDYTSIIGYPLGTIVRVFNYHTFIQIDQKSLSDSEKEHVTPVFYNHPNKFKIGIETVYFPNYRLTIDTKEDFLLMKIVYDRLYKGFPIKNSEVYSLLEKHPELIEINKDIKQIIS